MKIKVNDISYFVEVHQANNHFPNLVLLHGFMGSGRAFDALIESLCSFCNPVTIDLLGHGKTDGAEFPNRFAPQHQLSDLKEIITEISDRRVYLHGYSMGGRLALRFALKNPDFIKGLILESTNPGLKNEYEREQRRATDEEGAQAIENNFQSFLNEWKTLSIFQNGVSVPNKRLDNYHAIQREQIPQQMAHSLRGFGTGQMLSVEPKLPDMNIPVLILAGEADQKYTEISQQMHNKILQSVLSIIPDGAHRIHLENPEAVATKIQNFIKSTMS